MNSEVIEKERNNTLISVNFEHKENSLVLNGNKLKLTYLKGMQTHNVWSVAKYNLIT